MQTKKKKILWNSDCSKLKTGFGRNSKAVLKYLYDTGKYDVIEYCCAPFTFGDERLKALPWKAYGAVPESSFVRETIANGDDEGIKVSTRYGSYYIDELIEKERPDFFIGVNDFWAFREYYDKPWWNKVNCALWITLDSLPIYTDAIQNAHKIKNFWVWSKFAENEMNRLGFDHVKTIHGAFDVSDFKPLDNKKDLKKSFGLENNTVFGFVFRNQIRKLIGTLIEGFSLNKKRYPKSNAKLLLHTCWSEGWDIPQFIEEFKVDKKDILATHICRHCKKYDIRSFTGEEVDCPHCGSMKSMITPSTGFGISDSEMNEIYNLMDFYIHPVTSGGLEMPIVESLLAGIPVATSSYSCGEEFCEQPFVIPIDFNEYRELGTQFRKAQPVASSIATIMREVEAGILDLNSASKAGREWALDQFDLNKICASIETWLDSCPNAIHDYPTTAINYNDDFEFDDSDISDKEWAVNLVKGIFGFRESELNDTIKKIIKSLKDGRSRKDIYNAGITSARNHNKSRRETSMSNFFKDEKDPNNVCFIAPQSLEDKIIVSKFFSELCLKEDTVFLVGTETDRGIFEQYGRFILIPSNLNAVKLEWLISLETEKGEKRFKKIFYKEGYDLKEFENK